MAVGSIRKTSVDALRSAGGKDAYLWDARLTGFGVKVTPTGSKTYLVQYRMGGRSSPTRRYTIGKHGRWTPERARSEARRILGLIETGVDPQQSKAQERREVVDLAFDAYAKRFLDVYGKKHWKPRTLADNKRYLTGKDSPVVATLGRKPLTKIRRSDIAAVFDLVPASKPGMARHVFSGLHRLFAWAVERGDIERSPMEGFRGPAPIKSRDRVLTPDELRLVWLAAGQLGHPFGTLYRVLVATGQRREEAAGLNWQELDQSAHQWNLPASRSKNAQPNIIPLNDLVFDDLGKAAGSARWPAKGLVFSTTGETPVSGHSKAKKRLDAKMLELAQEEAREKGFDPEDVEMTPWRVHDLRRTFATAMQQLGVRFEVTEAVLNHVSGAKGGVAGIYQRHDWRDEKRAALDAWSRYVGSLLSPQSDANVLRLPKSQ